MILTLKPRQLLLTVGLSGLLTVAGCAAPGGDVLHQKSVADLNAKAQELMQAGDTTGAVARLESAHDLEPGEVTTMYNLAIAYQMQGNHDKALAFFLEVQGKPGIDAAELQKALGITYEARADQLEAQAVEATENPKADQSQVAEKRQQAAEDYQQALAAYRQSLASGIKNPTEIQKQIEALEAKLNPERPAGP